MVLVLISVSLVSSSRDEKSPEIFGTALLGIEN